MNYEMKQTIAIMKKMVADGKITQEDAEKYCPELKESEDEEDEKRLNHIIQFLEDKDRWKDNERAFPIEEDVRWLKSRFSQKQWKPTEAMLRALRWAKSEYHPDCQETMDNLNYLYKEIEQLYYDRT